MESDIQLLPITMYRIVGVFQNKPHFTAGHIQALDLGRAQC